MGHFQKVLFAAIAQHLFSSSICVNDLTTTNLFYTHLLAEQINCSY